MAQWKDETNVLVSQSVAPTETNPKLAAGSKKISFAATPSSALVFLAEAMNDGAKKYGIKNWRKSKVIMSIYLDAIERHLLELKDGIDVASDSKLTHLAHIMANCAILLDAAELGVLIDDRPEAGNVDEIIAIVNEKVKNGIS